jgi:hypothetical protein
VPPPRSSAFKQDEEMKSNF